MKRTLVIGASPNPMRFSYKMIKSLLRHDYEVEAVGIRDGVISGIKIQKGKPGLKKIHTVTLYIGPQRQPEYYEYILSLKPKRIIFNPGTINPEFMEMAAKKGIEVVNDCALVMVASGNY